MKLDIDKTDPNWKWLRKAHVRIIEEEKKKLNPNISYEELRNDTKQWKKLRSKVKARMIKEYGVNRVYIRVFKVVCKRKFLMKVMING